MCLSASNLYCRVWTILFIESNWKEIKLKIKTLNILDFICQCGQFLYSRINNKIDHGENNHESKFQTHR
jgi:hypothetical protein